MSPPAQLKPMRSRVHARRLGKHLSQFFRTKKAFTAYFTGATRYELSSICSYSPSHIVRYTWDQQQVGYLSKTEDPSGSTSYERDAFGRTLSTTQSINDNPAAPSSYKTSYTYGTTANTGQLASITYPSGLKVIYNRSPNGQITGLNTQAPGRGKPVTPFVSSISYTALGQPKAWQWANGDTAARTFDLDGRMTGNEFASYTFDAASRITGITQSLAASLVTTSTTGTGTATSTISTTSYYQSPINWAISYDSRNRITGFNRPSAQASYSYDANSNRLSAINKKVSDSDLDGDFDQADKAQTIAQSQNIDTSSNQLLGFTQTTTGTKGDRTLAITTSQVSYALDAAGNMTTDGLRTFSYDSANRHSQTTVTKDGEASKITYLHNANGQRVFKSEPQAEDYKPNETVLGTDFIAWLKKNFSWLFAQAQTNATLGQSYVYADSASQLPGYALLGEYGNGGASSSGRLEYIWLPTEDGSADAVPIGLYRNGKFFAVHSDHLNTPRKITDETNKLVWQWPYSAFGDNKPTGILKATVNPNNAYTQDPTTNARLQATTPAITFNLRMPGQYFDFETGLFYNTFRTYNSGQGRYTQGDPIGLGGGVNRFAYVGGNPISRVDPTGQFAMVIPFIPAIITGTDLAIGAGLGALGYGLDRMFNVPARGLPPEGINPPTDGQCKPGPASRPSERDKGGQSLWDPTGGEWRWSPGDKWHNPHWDQNPHDRPSSPWVNVPHGGLPPVKQ
jgi:RHS repeat-associated protein